MNKLLIIPGLFTLALCSHAAAIERVSVSSSGEQSNGISYWRPQISNTGQVTFISKASNLVDDDTSDPAVYDLFLHDPQTGQTEQINITGDGAQDNGKVHYFDSSKDARYIVFQSSGTNLVSDTIEQRGQIFLRDRQNGETTLISRGIDGQQANGFCANLAISDDGNIIVYRSYADNLVAENVSREAAIYLHDRTTGVTELISKALNGDQANGVSYQPNISGNGQIVAYQSTATNLSEYDNNSDHDIYAYDRATGITELISVNRFGRASSGVVNHVSLSYDGSIISFDSRKTDLIENDNNDKIDVFFRDRNAKTTVRISENQYGREGDRHSIYPTVSADGNLIFFESSATNLISNDTNRYSHGYLFDRVTSTITKTTLSQSGEQANESSRNVSISPNGRFLAFSSKASNLVPNDTNGLSDHFLIDRQPAPTSSRYETEDGLYSGEKNVLDHSSILSGNKGIEFGWNTFEDAYVEWSVDIDVTHAYDIHLGHWFWNSFKTISLVVDGVNYGSTDIFGVYTWQMSESEVIGRLQLTQGQHSIRLLVEEGSGSPQLDYIDIVPVID